MFKKYFNKVLLYNILIAIGVVTGLLLIVQAGLKSYTRHGESIAVPDLRGKSMEQVTEILSEKNLEWQIMDSVYDMKKPPLSIVDQNPKPNSGVKEGRTIYLTLNATTAPAVEIPDLIGRSSFKYAKMQLESYGLKLGEPVYRPDPHLYAVIGMMVDGRNVTRKMKVPKGTEVTLVLGDGLGGGKTAIPYLIGLRLDDAEFKLKGYSLNIGAIIAEEGVTDTAGAVVYRQIPPYNATDSIRMGEPVDLFVAKELPAGIIVDPSLYHDNDSIPEE